MKKTSSLIILALSAIIANADQANAANFTFYLYGKHYDCNTPYALKVGTRENCEVNCPNRIYILKDRTCRLKVGESKPHPTEDTPTIVDADNCKKKVGTTEDGTISKEYYFLGKNESCYSCNTKGSVKVSKSSCSATRFCNQNCDQRVKRAVKEGSSDEPTYYSVLKCPDSRPLMDRFMMCWSCDEKTPIDLSFNQDFNSVCKGKNKRKMYSEDGVRKEGDMGVVPKINVPFSYPKD